MQKTHLFLGAGLLLCALSGCTMAPQYLRPDMPVPAQLPVADSRGQAGNYQIGRASCRERV